MKRVVVTGIGMITPLGGDVETTWSNIIESKSGITKIDCFDASSLTAQIAGQVPFGAEKGQYNVSYYIAPKEQKKMDQFIHFAVSAAIQAVEDSGWKPEDEESQCRTGTILSSGIGGLTNIMNMSHTLEEKGPRRVSPFFIPSCLINLASGHLSIKYGFKGPNHSIVTACATGAHSIGESARIIRDGDADVMVAGGSESSINKLGMAGFAAAKTLSTNYNDSPEKASRPWDKARDGFVMGEGGAVVVLEEYEHAKKRGAKIYAELIGYGTTGDAYHITSPSSEGGYRAMTIAMKKAGLNAEDIDYVNAHGTSTPAGDLMELQAVKRVLGDHIEKVSISSTKSAIGHLLGAAGSVEAIFSLLAIKHNTLPPTLNLDNPEDDCLGIDLVPFHAKDKNTKTVLSNSFGFGGTNASLIFKAV